MHSALHTVPTYRGGSRETFLISFSGKERISHSVGSTIGTLDAQYCVTRENKMINKIAVARGGCCI